MYIDVFYLSEIECKLKRVMVSVLHGKREVVTLWLVLALEVVTGMDSPTIHDDVIKWKHFPRYWPFVRGIHGSPVNSPHKGQWRGALMFSLICALNKRLSKQSWGRWFEMPTRSLWRRCNEICQVKAFPPLAINGNDTNNDSNANIKKYADDCIRPSNIDRRFFMISMILNWTILTHKAYRNVTMSVTLTKKNNRLIHKCNSFRIYHTMIVWI